MKSISRRNQTQDSDVHRSQEFDVFHHDKSLESKTDLMSEKNDTIQFCDHLSKRIEERQNERLKSSLE